MWALGREEMSTTARLRDARARRARAPRRARASHTHTHTHIHTHRFTSHAHARKQQQASAPQTRDGEGAQNAGGWAARMRARAGLRSAADPPSALSKACAARPTAGKNPTSSRKMPVEKPRSARADGGAQQRHASGRRGRDDACLSKCQCTVLGSVMVVDVQVTFASAGLAVG